MKSETQVHPIPVYRSTNVIPKQKSFAGIDNKCAMDFKDFGKLRLFIWFLTAMGLFHWRGCVEYMVSRSQRYAVFYSATVLLAVHAFYTGKAGYNVFSTGQLLMDNAGVFRTILLIWLSVIFCWYKNNGLHNMMCKLIVYKKAYAGK